MKSYLSVLFKKNVKSRTTGQSDNKYNDKSNTNNDKKLEEKEMIPQRTLSCQGFNLEKEAKNQLE